MKLLIIEDSQYLLRSLGTGLRKMGYAVDLVADGAEGLDFARLNDYDVIVLDLMLPTMDGLTVLQRLRAIGKMTHILILSAKDRVEDRIRGLQLGADDYMIKPFSFDELCARIQTLVRRRYSAKNPEIAIGGLLLRTAARTVLRDGHALALTPAEYNIFEHLALSRGRGGRFGFVMRVGVARSSRDHAWLAPHRRNKHSDCRDLVRGTGRTTPCRQSAGGTGSD